MESGSDPFDARAESASPFKKLAGAVLLAGGAFLCAWTFSQVIALLAGEEVRLVTRLIPLSRTSRSLLLEGQQVELPATLFEFGAYGMAIGLLSVAATMANALIRGGAALLQPDLGRQLDRLRRQVAETLKSRGS